VTRGTQNELGLRRTGNDTIIASVKHQTLLAVVATALAAGGCLRRQTATRLIYVPAQAPAASQQPGTSTEALVIEEPPPPPPPVPIQVIPLPEPATQKPTVRPRRSSRTELPSSEGPAEPPSSPEVPPLEPRATSAEQERLRAEITGLQAGMRQRIGRLNRKRLSEADQKTLDDAVRFLGESERAFAETDLQRSLNLAHKASLLLDAVEKSY
jgi:hypothetical protein